MTQKKQSEPTLPATITSQGGVVARKARSKTIQEFFQAHRGALAMACPTHLRPEVMLRTTFTEIMKNPKLLQCTIESLYSCAIQSAQLGLPFGVIGLAYMVPFSNAKKGTSEAQFMPGYKGLMQLARNSGQVGAVDTGLVFHGDTFDYSKGLKPILHHIEMQREVAPKDSELTHAYAIATLRDGTRQMMVMQRWEWEMHRARSRAKSFGPWVTDYPAMALKTVIRKLCKFLPVSAELQTAIALDERLETGKSQQLEIDFPVPEDDNGAIDSDYTVIAPSKPASTTKPKSDVPPALIAKLKGFATNKIFSWAQISSVQKDLELTSSRALELGQAEMETLVKELDKRAAELGA